MMVGLPMQASKWNQDILVELLNGAQLLLSWATRLERRLDVLP